MKKTKQKIGFLMLTTYFFAWIVGIVGTNTYAQENGDSNGGRGGGFSTRIDAAALRMLLEGDYLKTALLYYLRSIKVDLIADPEVRATFQRMSYDGRLRAEVLTPGIYTVGSQCFASRKSIEASELEGTSKSPGHKDPNNSYVPASTEIGKPGSPICFDSAWLLKEYGGLAMDEVLRRLASLAIHEHVHHFQNPKASEDTNEFEAYQAAAYVRITAKIDQVAVMRWDPSALEDSPLTETPTLSDYVGEYSLTSGPSSCDKKFSVSLATDDSINIKTPSGSWEAERSYTLGRECIYAPNSSTLWWHRIERFRVREDGSLKFREKEMVSCLGMFSAMRDGFDMKLLSTRRLMKVKITRRTRTTCLYERQ